MKNVVIAKGHGSPSKMENSLLPRMFTWRKTGEFVGESSIEIGLMTETTWWNRPEDSDEMVKLEDDGLYSYNLPFLGDRPSFKTQYNVLLPANCFVIVWHIKTDDTWTDNQVQSTIEFPFRVLYDVLVDLGVPADRLSVQGNDMLFDDKKFCGAEGIYKNEVYTGAMVCTLTTKQFEEIFQRLTGKYAHKKEITGIVDEVPGITLEDIESLYIEKTENLFDSL